MNTKSIVLIMLVLVAFMSANAMAATPDPTTITNETGSIWVRWDWVAGSGNVTDSYNISLTRCGDDQTWVNGTINTYVRFTTSTTPKICAGAATIEVFAYNTTYNELSGGVTNAVTIPLVFGSIVNLIDAVIPLFNSVLNLIIAVFPLVIAVAFLGGLAYLIDKIFDGATNFNFKGKK